MDRVERGVAGSQAAPLFVIAPGACYSSLQFFRWNSTMTATRSTPGEWWPNGGVFPFRPTFPSTCHLQIFLLSSPGEARPELSRPLFRHYFRNCTYLLRNAQKPLTTERKRIHLVGLKRSLLNFSKSCMTMRIISAAPQATSNLIVANGFPCRLAPTAPARQPQLRNSWLKAPGSSAVLYGAGDIGLIGRRQNGSLIGKCKYPRLSACRCRRAFYLSFRTRDLSQWIAVWVSDMRPSRASSFQDEPLRISLYFRR